MSNPYNYHLPVQEDAMFFGRAQLLQRLFDGLAQPRPLSAAVFGGRRCGKTSLLRKLERTMRGYDIRGQGQPAAARQLIPWYYDPQAGYPISSGDDFFLLALEALRQAICAKSVSPEQVQTAFRSAGRLGPANAFAESFRWLADQAGQRVRLVLLVDEAEVLLTSPWGRDLRPNLRNLLSNSAIADSLALVMAGSTAFHAQVAEKDSPLENILTRYTLANLTHEEALALARTPNENCLSPEAAEEVWRQTGGHPCLAQYILYELWAAYLDGDLSTCAPADVQDVAAGFSSQVDHFERWSTALNDLAHAAYGWLLERDVPSGYSDIRRQFSTADGGDLQRALDVLIYHGLLNVAGRGRHVQYSVAGVMFPDWYRSDRPASQPVEPITAAPTGAGTPPVYDTFDLEIEVRGPARYEVQVLNAPTGPVRGTETSFDPHEAQFRDMAQRVQIGDTDAALLTQIGGRLHEFLFGGPILADFIASREAARARGRGLSVKLRLHQPELAALPWELLYSPQDRGFLALSNRTPLARSLPRVIEAPLLPASLPWRLLLVAASPTDWPPLNIEQEQQAILAAVAPLARARRVEIVHLGHATPTALLTALRKGVHWLHFVGHGEYDATGAGGALILERDDGKGVRMDAETLRQLLPEVGEGSGARLRMAFLNACATAQVGMTPGTRGLAQSLAQAGLPVAIGMSRPISDQSARAFSQGFYEALADSWPVEAAVSEGRRRVMVESGLHSGDWAVPILFI